MNHHTSAGLADAYAVVRTVADDLSPAEPGDAGSHAGMPSIQGRVGYAWSMACENASP